MENGKSTNSDDVVKSIEKTETEEQKIERQLQEKLKELEETKNVTNKKFLGQSTNKYTNNIEKVLKIVIKIKLYFNQKQTTTKNHPFQILLLQI